VKGRDPDTVRKWQSRWNNYSYMKAQVPILRANTKKAYDAGLLVVAGSDSSDSGAGLFNGLTAQVELLSLVESGLTPQQALQTATINAARMIGREMDLGSVEAHKLADLVILNADPLIDIRNISDIHLVVKGGVVRDPAELLRAAK
jgi:imidazolonepropionase-like amidohydrolase